MYAFYILAITDLQDLLPVLLTAISKNKKCWVCFVDSLYKKRQLYYYEPDELKGFIKEVCKNNNLPCPEVDFFGQNDKAAFDREYQKRNPEYVFLQNVYHKYPSWLPTAESSKVINISSTDWPEKSQYRVFLNFPRYHREIETYNKHQRNSNNKYFGNLRLENLLFKPCINFEIPKKLKNKKICFIPETHARKKESHFEEYPKCVDRVIDFLHKNDYIIIWKTREKGYPYQDETSVLKYCKNKPDIIINKDINFPSSVYYVPTIADICLTFNFTSCYEDVVQVNKNTYTLQTPKLTKQRLEHMQHRKRLYPHCEIINFESENCWQILKNKLTKKRELCNITERPSTRLLEHIEIKK